MVLALGAREGVIEFHVALYFRTVKIDAERQPNNTKQNPKQLSKFLPQVVSYILS